MTTSVHCKISPYLVSVLISKRSSQITRRWRHFPCSEHCRTSFQRSKHGASRPCRCTTDSSWARHRLCTRLRPFRSRCALLVYEVKEQASEAVAPNKCLLPSSYRYYPISLYHHDQFNAQVIAALVDSGNPMRDTFACEGENLSGLSLLQQSAVEGSNADISLGPLASSPFRRQEQNMLNCRMFFS